MTAVMAAKDQATIGYANWVFGLPHCGGDGPEFTKQLHNPREATVETLKDLENRYTKTGGFKTDRLEWAMIMGVKRSWIKNLDEISQIRPGSVAPIPDIIWTDEAKDGKADLFNGNHRYKLIRKILTPLLMEKTKLKDKIRNARGPQATKQQRAEKEANEKRHQEIIQEILEKGKFVVQLIDLGKSLRERKCLHV